MKIYPSLFVVALLLMVPCACYPQFSAIENAKRKIYSAGNDAERLDKLVAICKLRNSLHGDTIFFYANWAKKLAMQLNNKRQLAWAEYSLISASLAKGKTDSVIHEIENNKAFKDIKKTDAALYYKVQLLKANALNRMNNRTEALDLQLKLLNEAEKEDNTNAQLFALNFIGATYLNVNKADDAKQAWLHGLAIISNKRDSTNNEIEAYILSNLALYYFDDFYIHRSAATGDSFLTVINKALGLSTKNENLGVLASCYSLRGKYFGLNSQFDAGEKDLKAGLEIRKVISDPLYVVNDYAGLATFYISQKKYPSCIEATKEGIDIANRAGIKGAEIGSLLYLMGQAHKAMGSYQLYSSVLEQFMAAADSSNKINAAEKIADIQTKYEVQKKETLIAQQKLDLLQRSMLLYGGVIAVVSLLAFLAYRFKKYKQLEKIKLAAMMEEEKRRQELSIKEAEEKERRRIAAELHDNLGVQANAILHGSSLLNTAQAYNKNVVTNLQETAKEMLLNLRETLWAMKTTDVSSTELWLRIINFIKQMSRHYPSLQFKLEGEAPKNVMLHSNKALNIILALQETVNNAVKHADATNIVVSSETGINGWNICVKDDGKGFDLSIAGEKAESYGLQHMKERAAAADFMYQIETAPGNGTSTSICIKL